MGLRVLDLWGGGVSNVKVRPFEDGRPEGGGGKREAHFYLEEVLWWTVYLLEALLAGIGHCLHVER